MQEDTQRTDLATDPTPAVDTQEQTQQTPVQDDAGHVEAQQPSEGSTSQTPSQQPKSDEVAKREEGKLRQVQKELAEVKRSNEAQIKYFMKNPARFKEGLIEVDGYTPEQAEQAVAQLKQRNPALWAETQREKKQDQSTIDPQVLQQVVSQLPDVQYARQLREEANRREMDEFFKNAPDLDPNKVDPDKVEEARAMAGKVGYIGDALMAVNPSLKPAQAWTQAYSILTGKAVSDSQKAKEDGKIEGMLLASADRASSMSSASGKQQGTKSYPALTELQRQVAKEAGMSEQEYAENLYI